MIEITNLTTNPIDENFIKNIVEKVLKEEKIKKDISIAFIGPNRMKKLNKRYKKVNRTTDVLSFGEIKRSRKKEKSFTTFPERLELAEIVICPRELKKNSKRFNTDFKNELARVLIHGILHLLGYDHQKKEDKKNMKAKEDSLLLCNKTNSI